MLEQLFGSKMRVQLLMIFLANPSQRYYLRELTRLFSTQINSVRREINNLTSLGILKEVEAEEEEKGKKKRYFQANPDFPLYQELRGLVLKAPLLSSQGLGEKLKKAGKWDYAALTGVFTQQENAATDIFLVGKADKEAVEKIIQALEKDLNRSLNYTIFSRKEFFYRRDITDRFLYNILEGAKIVLIDKIFR